MSMTKDELLKILSSGLPGSQITIEDLAGDGDHYAATIISKKFEGLNKIQQHKLVYVLWVKRWDILFMPYQLKQKHLRIKLDGKKY